MLGQGGMGFVFQAEDEALRRLVALKVMRPDIATKTNAHERFLREGRATAAVASDHVVTIFQVSEGNGVPFMAMELLQGSNLEDWLKARPVPASTTDIVWVAKDVLRGLAAAHGEGLIHRDIKPANLWVVSGTNRIKVLDFGLTRGTADSVQLTADGTLLGTPAYMAPEQAADADVDARADLFSLGAVLFRMLAGKSPFERTTFAATLGALAIDEPPRVATLRTNIPEELAGLIDRLLARKIARRPATANDALAEVLEVERRLSDPPRVAVGTVPTVPAAVASLRVAHSASASDYPASPVEVGSRADRHEDGPAPRPSTPRRDPTAGLPKRGSGPRRAAAVIGLLALAVAAVTLVNRLEPGASLQTGPTVEGKKPETTQVQGVPPRETPKGTGDGPPSNSDEMGKTVPPMSWDIAPMPGEKEEFTYVIDEKPMKGTTRVVTLDLGGGVTMEFVRVPKGEFRMGAPDGEKDARDDEKPQRRVEISKEYYLGKFEVTQAQYKAVTGETPSEFEGGRRPVERVSWEEAVKFCEVVAKRTGRRVELPTEAEWEYAGRAGTTTPFHFGSKLNGDLANCDGNNPYGTDAEGAYKQRTAEVGSYPANPWGLYDMHGNVSEWCRDYYGPNTTADGTRDPVQLTKQAEDNRVIRGGSWISHAGFCRAADRGRLAPEKPSYRVGFRVSFRPD